ncbi:ABC transporter permease [Limisalsivibrio acetivorans]|uniref:ABC transporter permease n=1 Tax=Limisalsivibrio acetivorans TaxID=1304888 RepID=UPI0003B41823|nr:ABC transporter permease [Limisalsivibrio acetivorans]
MARRRAAEKAKGNFLFIFGGSIVLFFIFVAALAPVIAPYDPANIDFDSIFLPPSAEHYFGTDELGRDVFSRVVYGTRISLFVGFVAVGISVIIGTVLGLISGYFGSLADTVIMRFVDIMLCFPSFFLILAVIAFLNPSIFNVMLIIGLTSWMGVTRLVRAETMSVKTRDYIAAAKTQGLSSSKILFKHIFPNVFTPIFITATLGIAGAILTESALSFLGLGVQPPTPSWGNILTSGKDNIMFAWWLSFFPGMAIFITVLGYNLLGEGLRDILDPKE